MIKEDTQINSIFHIIKDIFRLFYYNRKKESVFLLLIILFSSVFELVTFAFIIPVIYLINNPKPIFNNTYLNFIYLRMHFKAPVFFIFFLFFLIFVVFLIKNLFLLFSNFLQNKFTYKVAGDIVERQMTRFYKNNYMDIKQNNSIEYLRCLVEAPLGYAENLMIPLIFILNETLVITLVFIGLFLYKPIIVILILVTILPFCLLLLRMAKNRLQSISEVKGNLEKETYLETIEGIHAYTDIKLFNKEDLFIRNIKKRFAIL